MLLQMEIFHSHVAEQYAIVNMYHILTHLNRHLDCFHVLAVMSNAAMNIAVHVSFQISVFVFFF